MNEKANCRRCLFVSQPITETNSRVTDQIAARYENYQRIRLCIRNGDPLQRFKPTPVQIYAHRVTARSSGFLPCTWKLSRVNTVNNRSLVKDIGLYRVFRIIVH